MFDRLSKPPAPRYRSEDLHVASFYPQVKDFTGYFGLASRYRSRLQDSRVLRFYLTVRRDRRRTHGTKNVGSGPDVRRCITYGACPRAHALWLRLPS